ncbi:MAG: hypothetical protein AAFX79_00235 [Planctomycetota bacterium]
MTFDQRLMYLYDTCGDDPPRRIELPPIPGGDESYGFVYPSGRPDEFLLRHGDPLRMHRVALPDR